VQYKASTEGPTDKDWSTKPLQGAERWKVQYEASTEGPTDGGVVQGLGGPSGRKVQNKASTDGLTESK
jgi:hypothetical protein